MKKLISLFLIALTILSLSSFAYAKEEGESFSFDLISDIHISSSKGGDRLIEAFANMSDSEADTLVIAGDLTNRGKKSEIDYVFSLLSEFSPYENNIIAFGNHDTQMFKNDESRENLLQSLSDFTLRQYEKVYYSKEINGYKFIVMGDEGHGINTAKISDEQISFIKNEISSADEEKPVFVICHWPLKSTHGASFLWPILPGAALSSKTSEALREIFSSRENIFYLSGHLHAGLNGDYTKARFGACCIESEGNVNLINAPAFGKFNRFGVAAKGTGMKFRIYDDRAEIEGVNFLTNEKYKKYCYTVKF